MDIAMYGASRFRSYPSQLFQNGEKGVWIDPSDLSTLFQDSGGTTPVTAAGQTVALAKDKSGNGKDVTLTNVKLDIDSAGNYFLIVNSGTPGGSTASIDFTGTNKMSVFAAVRKLSDSAVAIVCELSANTNSNAGSFYLSAPDNPVAASGYFASAARGTALIASNQEAITTSSSYAAPITEIISTTHDISGNLSKLWLNRAATTDGTGSKGSGNFGNYPLYLFARGGTTVSFSGRLYGLIVRGAMSSANEIFLAERWLAQKAGVTL